MGFDALMRRRQCASEFKSLHPRRTCTPARNTEIFIDRFGRMVRLADAAYKRENERSTAMAANPPFTSRWLRAPGAEDLPDAFREQPRLDLGFTTRNPLTGPAGTPSKLPPRDVVTRASAACKACANSARPSRAHRCGCTRQPTNRLLVISWDRAPHLLEMPDARAFPRIRIGLRQILVIGPSVLRWWRGRITPGIGHCHPTNNKPGRLQISSHDTRWTTCSASQRRRAASCGLVANDLEPAPGIGGKTDAHATAAAADGDDELS